MEDAPYAVEGEVNVSSVPRSSSPTRETTIDDGTTATPSNHNNEELTDHHEHGSGIVVEQIGAVSTEEDDTEAGVVAEQEVGSEQQAATTTTETVVEEQQNSCVSPRPRRSTRTRKQIMELPTITTRSSLIKTSGKKPPPVKTNTRRSPSKRAVTPKFLRHPETGQQVWITTATVQDIQTAQRKQCCPGTAYSHNELVTVSSPTQRQEIYQRTADALAALEQRALPRFGGRLSWTCRVTIKEKSPPPFFRWNETNGLLELAVLPHLMEKMPLPPKFPGTSMHQSPEDNGETVDEILLKRPICGLSQLAWNERWRVPIPTLHYRWISPLQQESFTTRKAVWDHALQQCRQQVHMDKVLLGLAAPYGRPVKKLQACSQKMALQVGKLRFERDGLWVIGQEEVWGRERIEARVGTTAATPTWVAEPKTKKRKWTGLSYFLHCERKQHRDKRCRELRSQLTVVTPLLLTPVVASKGATCCGEEDTKPKATEVVPNDIIALGTVSHPDSATPMQKTKTEGFSFTLRHAEQELRQHWKLMPSNEQALWEEKAKQTQAEEETKDAGAPSVVTEEGSASDCSVSTKAAPSPPLHSQSDPVVQLNPVLYPENPRLKEFYRSRKWCLNPDQVQACYDAGMEHYDTIMNTVTARDLTRELADGFDLLRERGRGRFDMELPLFDTPSFDFLNNIKKSPWMPIVREILGKEVVLIHKGMFLSMPGAERQHYHQDGPHLTTQYQKPCHAINVFIPLVDLSEENGPTEFCLGSHILGNEDLDEDFIETPTVAAGTPVIFDYRLGHRGLANASAGCRPIVYCTYASAADGKEFKDSVNFSRKRYHRIGDLISKGISREERAKKRKRVVEESMSDTGTT